MSTNATIGIQNKDKTVDTIYLHWDGYPSACGRTLQEYYQDEDKIRALISLGDISSLDREIGEKHDFDNCPDGVVNAYGRDRGETGVDKITYPSLEETVQSGGRYPYIYVWVDGQWLYRHGSRDYVPLTEELLTKDSEEE